MKEPNDNELINQIKEVLQDYEEPYPLGAWERFQRSRKKRAMTFGWKVILGAAASLAAIAVATVIIEHAGQDAVVAPSAPFIEIMPFQEQITAGKELETAGNKGLTELSGLPLNPHQTIKNLPSPESAFRRTENISSEPAVPTTVAADRKTAAAIFPVLAGIDKPSTRIEMAYYKTILTPESPENDEETSFRIGVALAPMISGGQAGSELGVSGGVATEWTITGKFSLSSGVLLAQNQLLYESGIDELARVTNLNSVQANLVSLELPINLQYHVNDNLFIAAGISSATFLKENYDYTYEFETTVLVTEETEGTGPQTVSRTVRTLETEEKTEPALNTFDLAAFYNLSFGYQYGLNNMYISVEPFVKFPATGIANKNLKYSAGGIQLKVKF